MKRPCYFQSAHYYGATEHTSKCAIVFWSCACLFSLRRTGLCDALPHYSPLEYGNVYEMIIIIAIMTESKQLNIYKGNSQCGSLELELELKQTQMAQQQPMLRAEVYARALRASQKREESRGVGGRAMRLMRGRGVGECGRGRNSYGLA